MSLTDLEMCYHCGGLSAINHFFPGRYGTVIVCHTCVVNSLARCPLGEQLTPNTRPNTQDLAEAPLNNLIEHGNQGDSDKSEDDGFNRSELGLSDV